MDAKQFKEVMDASFGVKMIIAGLTHLIEDEGYTTRESFEVLEDIKRNTFHALQEISRGEA